MKPAWKNYEDAARKVLTNMRESLNIASVEGKQTLQGTSGTSWELDAVARQEGSSKLMVIEVRCYTTTGLTQEAVGGIAYRIQDLGGAGGVVVSPLPLQKGAKIIAAKEGIVHLRLDPDSTTETYLAEFMGKLFYGVSAHDTLDLKDWCDAVVIRGVKPPEANQRGGANAEISA